MNTLNEGYSQEKFVISHASGSKIYTTEGTPFIDLAMGGGSLILGHSHPILKKAITEQLEKGSIYASQSQIAVDYSKKLAEVIPFHNKFVFCNSGSEATLRALRIARALTNRNKVAMFSGGWHGSHDFLLFEDDPLSPQDQPMPVYKSSGSPEQCLNNIIILPYNNSDAKKMIVKHASELAAVIIEPIQGSNPQSNIFPFLKELRDWTSSLGIPLIFDEVITGGRLAIGGAQEYFSIQADIATFGKVLGGGLPFGLVSITDEIHAKLTKLNSWPFMGGTFSANPLVCSSGYALIQYLQNNPSIYTTLCQNAKHIRDVINDFCFSQKIDAHMIGVESINRLIFSNKTIRSRRERDSVEASLKEQGVFYKNMLSEGVHIGSNGINFISCAHSSNDINDILIAYKKCLLQFKKDSFRLF